MNIYYIDEHIVVCEKPFGVSSQKNGGENMVDILCEKTGGEIYPVHRLDVQTTGLMVYARTEKISGELCGQIANREMEKEYLCLCHGTLEDWGEMEDLLFHDRVKNKTFVADKKRHGVKEARLIYEVISKKTLGTCELNLVRVKLLTGRTHQIRVQFASRGCPVYGDGKYGAKDNDRIHLHSCRLAFDHPVSGERHEYFSVPEWAEGDVD